MKFERYRVLFFTLLGISMTALVGQMIYLSFGPSVPSRLVGKTLWVIACLSLGIASLVNVACGSQHNKMWGRGGLRSYRKDERTFYLIDTFTFSVGGVFMLVLAIKFWLVPI